MTIFGSQYLGMGLHILAQSLLIPVIIGLLYFFGKVLITHGTDDSELEPHKEVIVNFREQGGTIVIPTLPDKQELSSVNLKTEHPQIVRFWVNGGRENIKRLFNYIGAQFLGQQVPVEKAIELPFAGIYHPKANTIFADLESYLEWYRNHGYDPQKPLVGIKFYKVWVAREEVGPVDALVRALEAKGANVVPIYQMNANEREKPSDYDELNLFKRKGKVLINSLVTFIFHGGPTPHETRVQHLAGLDVPILHAALSALPLEEWETSQEGIAIANMHMLFIPAELRGAVNPIVVAARKNLPSGDHIYVPIPDQADRFAQRVISWSRLGIKPNSEKKVTIVYYNYPPGKDNAAGASNLNVPRSLPGVLEAMAGAGYRTSSVSEDELVRIFTSEVRNIGRWEKKALEEMVQKGQVVLLPEKTYLDWFNQLPQARRDELVRAWGPPPGELMVYTDAQKRRHLVIPRLELGNVILAPQPLRADETEDRTSTHDTTTPPPHQYVAFYLWLQKEFGADAIVHFGTHGSLEFLPDKERGLAITDWPLLLLQDMPVIYPYIMDNVGEGMIARRRGSAMLVNHLTPPLIAAGLYGELVLIHDYIH